MINTKLKSNIQSTANPPYPPRRYTISTALGQYVIIVRILLTEYRTTWFFYVFTGLLIPLGFVFFVKAVGGVSTPARAIFLLGGNMAASIVFSPTSFLINKIGWSRQNHEFDYWVSLPLPKLALVFAIVTVALVFSFVGLTGVYVLGCLFFQLPFTNVWALLPLIPLGVLSLAGLGALLGIYAPDGQTANTFSNLLMIFVSFLSPTMIPAQALPGPLRLVSWFVPTTYIADAFRLVLAGQLNSHLLVDMLILLLFSGVLLSCAYLRLDWRTS